MIKNILDFLLLPFDLLFKKFALRNNIGFLPPVQPTHQKFPLIILGGEYAIKHQIPTSVIFNTGSGPITVGNNAVFGHNVQLLTGYHLNVEDARRLGKTLHDVPDENREIIIGNNCYIGSNAIILGNVKIGDYSVIAAGSVVYKDVPQSVLVGGNPAIQLRKFENGK
jgi:acetyltransferase-like isoleucine patch superfamily enzyme